jgi:hypothetical protein
MQDVQDVGAALEFDNVYRGKFDLFSLTSLSKVTAWIFGFAFASVITVVGVMRGEVTMLDSEATKVDVAVDILGCLMALLLVASTVVSCFNPGLAEMTVLDGWTKCLLGAIRGGSDWSNAQNEKLDFYLRLDNPEAVDSFEVLYACVESVNFAWGEYHMATFEILIFLSIAAVVCAFIATIFHLPVVAWNVLLILSGTATLLVTSIVFFKMVTCHSRLGATMCKMLWHQRHLNDEGIEREVAAGSESDEDRVQVLRIANKKIVLLEESISVSHRPRNLFGAIPLTKDNVIKGVAAITAVLFTTAMRQIIHFN